MRFFRLLKILAVAFRFGLDEFFLGHERLRLLRPVVKAATFWRRLERARAERLRLALEALGPIFVKFGQMLSTRRDLLPQDIADELAKLQDQVPPFPSSVALATLEQIYGKTCQRSIFAIRRRTGSQRINRPGASGRPAGRHGSCRESIAPRDRPDNRP